MFDNTPVKKLYEYMNSHIVSKAVALAISNRLDERLTDEPISVKDLCTQFNYHYEAGLRWLRALAAFQVVELDESGYVRAGTLSPYLDRLRGPHLVNGHSFMQHMDKSLMTGEACYETQFGKPFYQHLLDEPDLMADMCVWSRKTATEWLLPLANCYYNFSQHPVLHQVGGDFCCLEFLLTQNQDCRGVWCQTSEMIEGSQDVTCSSIVRDRIQDYPTDIFSNLPNADLYLFIRNLLGFSDLNAIKTLQAAKAAGNDGGKIVIIDYVIPDKDHPDYPLATIADLNVLTSVGGRLKDKRSWEILIEKAGFVDMKTIPVPSDQSPVALLPLFIMELGL